MSYQIKTKGWMSRCILFLAMLSLPIAAFAGNSGKSNGLSNRVNNGNHLSPELQALADSSTDGYVDVIIQFKNAPSGGDDSDVIGNGGAKTKQRNLINGNVYHVPVKSLKHLL